MKSNTLIITVLCLFLTLRFSSSTFAQSQDGKSEFQLNKGTILTSFSAGFVNANKVDNYNHEYEKAFDQISFNLNGLYFITDKIALGPALRLDRVHRKFEDPSGIETYEDQWNWEFKYGVLAGYFTSVSDLIKTNKLGNTHVFVVGGLNWRSVNFKIGNSDIRDKTEMAYTVSGGLLIPISKRAALEWSLTWESNREEYVKWQFDNNGQPELTGTDHRWPSVLSLSLGIKINF